MRAVEGGVGRFEKYRKAVRDWVRKEGRAKKWGDQQLQCLNTHFQS